MSGSFPGAGRFGMNRASWGDSSTIRTGPVIMPRAFVSFLSETKHREAPEHRLPNGNCAVRSETVVGVLDVVAVASPHAGFLGKVPGILLDVRGCVRRPVLEAVSDSHGSFVAKGTVWRNAAFGDFEYSDAGVAQHPQRRPTHLNWINSASGRESEELEPGDARGGKHGF